MATIEAVKGKADAQSPAPAAKAEIKPLPRGSATFLEITNCNWRTIVPAGIAAADLDLHPSFWNLLSEDIRAGDSIKAIAESRSWIAHFEVLDVSPGYVAAKLAYSMTVPLRTAAAGVDELPKGWEIVRSDPRGPDGWICREVAGSRQILNSGMPFETRELARRGLLDHAIFQGDNPTKYLPG